MAVNWTNITSTQDIINAPNQTTGGAFWLVVLYMFWIALIVSFSWAGIEVALLTATFLAIIVSLLMAYLGAIAFEWCLFFVGFEIFLILYIVWSSTRDNY